MDENMYGYNVPYDPDTYEYVDDPEYVDDLEAEESKPSLERILYKTEDGDLARAYPMDINVLWSDDGYPLEVTLTCQQTSGVIKWKANNVRDNRTGDVYAVETLYCSFPLYGYGHGYPLLPKTSISDTDRSGNGLGEAIACMGSPLDAQSDEGAACLVITLVCWLLDFGGRKWKKYGSTISEVFGI